MEKERAITGNSSRSPPGIMSCCSRSCLATSRAEEPETSIHASAKDGPASRSEAQRISQLRALEKSAQETRMKTTSQAETSARCTFSLQCPTPTEPGPGHRRERGWGLPKPPRRSAVARCNTSAIRTRVAYLRQTAARPARSQEHMRAMPACSLAARVHRQESTGR